MKRIKRVFIFLIITMILFMPIQSNEISFSKDTRAFYGNTIIIEEKGSQIETEDISETEKDNVTAKLYSNGLLEITGTGRMSKNANFASWNNEYTIRRVFIEEGVTNIGELMFMFFLNLEEVKIPSTVLDLGFGCFAFTNISSINISNNNPKFKTINSVIYSKDSTELIYYPTSKRGSFYQIEDGTIKIRVDAFATNNYLETVSIPSTVSDIETDTFSYTEKLENIIVNANNRYFSDDDGVLFNKDKTTLICYPNKPSNTKYTVPNTVKKIEEYSFGAENKLQELKLPDGLNSIGIYAFSGCSNLKTLTIPENVKELPNYIGFWQNENDLSQVVRVYCGSFAETFVKNKDSYRNIVTVHKVSNWNTVKEPTATEEGLKEGPCIFCKKTQQMKIDKISDEKLKVSTRYKTKDINDITYIILPKTVTVGEMLKQENITSNKQLKIVNLERVDANDNINVGTGFKVFTSDNTQIYTIVVLGDANGDGKVDFINDIIRINNFRLGKITVTKEVSLSGDVNEDGKVDFINDIIKINNFRLGKILSL